MSARDDRVETAAQLMLDFATDSGLTGEREPRRYLWTDAHAVCNFLSLARATGERSYAGLAQQLVDQVHEVLGRHRADDARVGWISGLADAAARQRPTAGGLRIGKPFPERRRDEPYDELAEWEQDGQYYHYLTKWMHALRQMAGFTGTGNYMDWARELALVALERFRAASGPPRLYWKMSIDLSYPLTPSSGLHDPLDGLVTALTLADAAQAPELDQAIAELTRLCALDRLATDDPLGTGGLLFDAVRIAQLGDRVAATHPALLGQVLSAASFGLVAFQRSATLRQPASRRLAFRELGLSIGLRGLPLLRAARLPAAEATLLEKLETFAELGAAIEGIWLDPIRQRAATWTAHGDINAVMLATSLVPEGFLTLAGPRAARVS